jgi:hypothetical protein
MIVERVLDEIFFKKISRILTPLSIVLKNTYPFFKKEPIDMLI